MKTLYISIIILIAFGVTPVFALDVSQINVGANPWAISVNPYINKVYVTNSGNDSVSVIDANTNTVTKEIIVGENPTGVVVNPDTGLVYVSRFSSPIVSVIDEKTYTITANITVGSLPNGLGVDHTTDKIYVTNMGDGTVSVIDGKTNTVTDTIPVQNRPTAVSVNPYTGMAYVTNSGSGTVSVINTKTNAVSSTIQTGKGPTGIVVDNYTDTVYVTDSPTSQVFVIDAKSNTVSSTIKVGPNPDGVSIDHTKNKIYVANSGDGTVSVIDGNTNTVSDTISAGTHTYAIATNPITGITYTANDSPGTVYVISDNTISSSQPNNSTVPGPSIITKSTEPPLKQLKSGIKAEDVTCWKGLQLIIKADDSSPACVKYTTANVLIERGWAKGIVPDITGSKTTVIIPVNSSNTSYGLNFTPTVVKTVIGINNTVRWINMDSVTNDITSDSFSSGAIESGYAWTYTFDKAGTYNYHSNIHPWLKGAVVVTANPMADLRNNAGRVSLGNQTYYFETPNYTETAYVNPVRISFHDVVFTLFPSGFRGGLPVPCNVQGSGQYYWTDTKFTDNTHELLHVFADSSCATNSIPTMFSNHTNPQAGLTFYDGKMKLLVSADNQISQKENTTLPASFEPCNTPYPQSNTGIAVLYMPANSVGKICVRYYNPNDTPESIFGIRIFDPNNSNQNATGITTWNDIDNNYTISKGGSTVVYWIKTGNQTGFYGLNLFCGGTPFAVGYDNNSKIVSSDFPFVGLTYSCPAMAYEYHIDSLTGIGVKYIPYP